MIDLEHIRRNYQSFADERIEQIARCESKGLRNEVIAVLVNEMESRNFDIELIDWVKAENRFFTEEENQVFRDTIEKSVCSICDSSKSKIMGFEFTTHIGFLKYNKVVNNSYLICKDCGKEKKSRSIKVSSTLGLLSIPGIISYPFLMWDKYKSNVDEENQSDRIIDAFIYSNIGEITLSNDDPEVIHNLITRHNNANEDF